MKDIGLSIGLNKASLYYYFKNKESLFSAVIFHEREKYLQSQKIRIKKIDDWKEKIYSYLLERYKYFDKAIALHNLSKENIGLMRPFFKELNDKVINKDIEFITDILVQQQELGIIKQTDSTKIAESVVTVSDSIKYNVFSKYDISKGSDFLLNAVNVEVRFIVNLIFDGLKN